MFNIEALIAGFYKDEKIRVDFTMVNPLNHNLDEDKLWFYFELSTLNKYENALDISQFNFYIKSKKDHIYNEVKRAEVQDEIYDDDNQLLCVGIKTLVAFEFNVEFLYYKTMLGFKYEQYDEIIYI